MSLTTSFRTYRRSVLVGLVSAALGVAALGSGCAAPKIGVKAPAAVESIESQQAPDFSAVDHRGQPVSFTSAESDVITALIFYRGAW